MTIKEEYARNLHLMPSTSGRAKGSSSIIRMAQLETMMEGSADYRYSLLNDNINIGQVLPTEINTSK